MVSDGLDSRDSIVLDKIVTTHADSGRPGATPSDPSGTLTLEDPTFPDLLRRSSCAWRAESRCFLAAGHDTVAGDAEVRVLDVEGDDLAAWAEPLPGDEDDTVSGTCAGR
jgi:hypothetical protein